MSEVTVYLAGAISKKEEIFCRTWRNIIKDDLSDIENIKIIDPIQGKSLNQEYDPKEIFTQDIINVRKSDIIVAELMLEDYDHVGTAMEIQDAYVYDRNKEIIIWGDKHKDHYFIRHVANKIFGTDELYKLINYLKEVSQGKDEMIT